ncbi:MAG: molecular chaperone [Alphaproteobacteria bacterium]|nr:molecular chaperone [Alphaproteobacteria bacterium]
MRLNDNKRNTFGAALLALLAASGAAQAGALQVSPINIEVTAGTSTTVENLENKGTTVINAQVRVFKWNHKDGKEMLVPTTDVVASPPALKIQPGGKATVRVVRLLKTPIEGEETYRLIIDDIPPPPNKAGDSVSFAVRHAIPVFFQAAGIKSQLAWTARMNGADLELHVVNNGQLHARLAQLTVLQKGATVAAVNGLAGYALAGDSDSWKLKAKGVHAGSTIEIKAATNDGPVDTTIQVQ